MVFSKPRYPRYAIDLSHPAIRYAIAAAMPLLFKINGPCLLRCALQRSASVNVIWLKAATANPLHHPVHQRIVMVATCVQSQSLTEVQQRCVDIH